MTTEKIPIISKQTLVPLSMAAALVIAAWWVSNATHKVELQLLVMNNRIGQLEEHVGEFKEATSDRWRRADMIQWAKMLAAGNPEMKIPEPM